MTTPNNPEASDLETYAPTTLAWIAADGIGGLQAWRAEVVAELRQLAISPGIPFHETFTPPEAGSLDERHAAAIAFLAAQGVAEALLDDLGYERAEAHERLDYGRGLVRAVIRAEALAQGEPDPMALVFDHQVVRATDWELGR